MQCAAAGCRHLSQLPSCGRPCDGCSVPELRCHQALSLRLQAKRRLCWVLQEAELTWRLTRPQFTSRGSSGRPERKGRLGNGQGEFAVSKVSAHARDIPEAGRDPQVVLWQQGPVPLMRVRHWTQVALSSQGLAARGCRLAAPPPAGAVRPQADEGRGARHASAAEWWQLSSTVGRRLPLHCTRSSVNSHLRSPHVATGFLLGL